MPALDVPLLAACALLGLVAGFLGGLLGIGGGVVIVPALLFLFDRHGLGGDLVTPMAVATSLSTIVFTSLAAARAQLRRGAVEWSLVRRWTPGLLLGSAVAGPLAARLPGVALQGFLGLFLGAAALVLLT
ncbi:MAG: sulfite exporter TauE/SafE family protein, partial [Pseudomonadales bacterium]|nr:sulfite exporter TauE/SafE family protein [Pseudomonadales bacterium]